MMYVFFIPAVEVVAKIIYNNSKTKFGNPESNDFKKHLERYVSKID